MFLSLSSRRRTNLFNDILFHKYSRFPNSSLVFSLGVLCSLRLPLFPGSDCAKAPPSGSSLVWKAVGQETVRATTNPCKRSLASHHHPSSQLFPLPFASEPNINFSLETKLKMPEALQDHKKYSIRKLNAFLEFYHKLWERTKDFSDNGEMWDVSDANTVVPFFIWIFAIHHHWSLTSGPF